MKVIGIERDKKFTMDGKTFTGLNLYLTTTRDGVEGYATEKVFINSAKDCYVIATTLKPGDEIKCYYNRYGKVDEIVPLSMMKK